MKKYIIPIIRKIRRESERIRLPLYREPPLPSQADERPEKDEGPKRGVAIIDHNIDKGNSDD